MLGSTSWDAGCMLLSPAQDILETFGKGIER